MQKIQLTEHFNLVEFTRSATAEANGIDNSLDPWNKKQETIINNLKNLCEHSPCTHGSLTISWRNRGEL